jgi:hypothetical protein
VVHHNRRQSSNFKHDRTKAVIQTHGGDSTIVCDLYEAQQSNRTRPRQNRHRERPYRSGSSEALEISQQN